MILELFVLKENLKFSFCRRKEQIEMKIVKANEKFKRTPVDRIGQMCRIRSYIDKVETKSTPKIFAKIVSVLASGNPN